MAAGSRNFLVGIVTLAFFLVVDAFSTTPRKPRSAPPPAAVAQPPYEDSPAWALLERHAGSRLERLTQQQLPRTAEAFLHGQVRIVSLLRIDTRRRQCTIQEPIVVAVPDNPVRTNTTNTTTNTIDFSQLITVWREDRAKDIVQALSSPRKQQQQPALLDPTFHALYQSRVGRGRHRVQLTKKMIRQWEEQSSDNDDKDVLHALRSVQKTGGGGHMPRLVDSWDAAHAVWDGSFGVGQRCMAARALGEDAADGGRFKRFPCVWVGTTTRDTKQDTVVVPPPVLFINGGWLVVDQCVRAGTEARKLVGRQGKVQSASDERIVRRLECLALGETLQHQNKNDASTTTVEVDVRETLKTLQLPITAEGATEALMQMGLWSSSDKTGFAAAIQPWSSDILQATKQYEIMLSKAHSSMDANETPAIVDLTQFPCVSIDSPKTRFRDDAIGVRSRASTGRRLHNGESKWEVLIHIADVSDVYAKPNRWHEERDLEALTALQDAAMRRGSSRYDLAHGPLHLLPPVVLEQLTLNKSQRAVTVWVYIDQTTGHILDCGVERTTISVPTAYSYAMATQVLSGKAKDDKLLPLLHVVSRLVSKWKSHHIQQNRGARQRSQRLATNRDMTRSPGHILVDDALDVYSHVASNLMVRAKAPVPKSLAASTSRGGRFATGPLRRAIDGQAQRQLLAVLCGYGQPLTLEDCKSISRRAVESTNAIATVRSSRQNVGRGRHS